MSSYLEGYGRGDERRERKLKILILSILGVSLTVTVLYFTFRDYREEKRIAGFLEALQKKDFPAAYAFWGCTQAVPCRDYPYEKFLEDWGPNGASYKLASGKVSDSERCGTGFISTLHADGVEDATLWVERETGVLGFAPWRECPEKKLRIVKWLKMRFGGE
jgi:hypothetical protein